MRIVAEQMTEDDFFQWFTALGWSAEDARWKARMMTTPWVDPVMPDGTPIDV